MIEKKAKFNPEELMKGAKPCLVVAEVTKRIVREKTYELIGKNKLKRDRNYSALMHQVAGEEYF